MIVVLLWLTLTWISIGCCVLQWQTKCVQSSIAWGEIVCRRIEIINKDYVPFPDVAEIKKEVIDLLIQVREFNEKLNIPVNVLRLVGDWPTTFKHPAYPRKIRKRLILLNDILVIGYFYK